MSNHLWTEIYAVSLKAILAKLFHNQTLTCTYDQDGLVNVMKNETETRRIEIVILDV